MSFVELNSTFSINSYVVIISNYFCNEEGVEPIELVNNSGRPMMTYGLSSLLRRGVNEVKLIFYRHCLGNVTRGRFKLDGDQSLFSSKIREEERNTSERANVTTSVTRSRPLTCFSFFSVFLLKDVRMKERLLAV